MGMKRMVRQEISMTDLDTIPREVVVEDIVWPLLTMVCCIACLIRVISVTVL